MPDVELLSVDRPAKEASGVIAAVSTRIVEVRMLIVHLRPARKGSAIAKLYLLRLPRLLPPNTVRR